MWCSQYRIYILVHSLFYYNSVPYLYSRNHCELLSDSRPILRTIANSAGTMMVLGVLLAGVSSLCPVIHQHRHAHLVFLLPTAAVPPIWESQAVASSPPAQTALSYGVPFIFQRAAVAVPEYCRRRILSAFRI